MSRKQQRGFAPFLPALEDIVPQLDPELTAILERGKDRGNRVLVVEDPGDWKIGSRVDTQLATLQRLNEWSQASESELRLRCGELTPQEIRLIRAVLASITGRP